VPHQYVIPLSPAFTDIQISVSVEKFLLIYYRLLNLFLSFVHSQSPKLCENYSLFIYFPSILFQLSYSGSLEGCSVVQGCRYFHKLLK
jgi:hypothetical protein